VLLRMLAAGVCHSDVHIWEGWYDLGGGKKLMAKDRGLLPPITMGHEIVGEVVALGPEADGVKIGDKRLAHPWIGCGSCDTCRRGNEHFCLTPRFLGIQRPGGYADHVLVPHPRYLVDIGKLTPAQAAPYACSGITTYGALKRVGEAVFREQPILVIGAGGLGLMCLTILKAMGGRGAVVADIDPKKREAALAAGALAAIDAGAADAVKQAQAAAGAPLAAAIDFVGANATARLGIDALARGGKYVIVGLFGGDITLSLPLLPMRALTIQGSYVGSLAEIKELMALVAGGKVAPMPVSERPLDEANTVLEELRAGRITGRAVLRP
jgi:propanol-preferring alcohol dehydrogenase